MAHAIGMVTVAEGVETRGGQPCLIEPGCDQFQGIGLSRPVSAEWSGSLLVAHASGTRAFAAEAAAQVAVRQQAMLESLAR